jgi:hypothetical protein
MKSVLVSIDVPFGAVVESEMTQDRVKDRNIWIGKLVATVFAISEFTPTILLNPAKPPLLQIPWKYYGSADVNTSLTTSYKL